MGHVTAPCDDSSGDYGSKKYLVKTDIYNDYKLIALTDEEYNIFRHVVKKGMIREHFAE